ncbi:hypothetical protein [Butyrivibrio sp. AC2005]|uniref:hypothetical protein n=1 Tax=Butyrivibrio sp. AC2005 TaxID=1280672 RepID=UPI0003F9BFC8|nr:hypothetical protein [Butyrivibrio sp. AC2005]
MSSKDRYLSKEEYKRYERLKSDIKGGRLLDSEGLLYLAESVDNDPTRLGLILLKKIEQFKEEDPYQKSFSNNKLVFEPSSEELDDVNDFLPYIGCEL